MPAELPPADADCHDGGPDDLLAVALAAGREVKEAAEAAGVSPRTAYRRLAEGDFRKRVAELRAAMVDRASGVLADGMSDAAEALRKLLDSEDERVCLAAAKVLLESSVKIREAAELEARLVALENARKPR